MHWHGDQKCTAGTKQPWFEVPCCVLAARESSSSYAKTSRELSCCIRSALGTVEAGGDLCGENEESGKTTGTKMAFANRTSVSVSRQEGLQRECFIGMRSSTNLRALQMHRTCFCNCDADERHLARKHVISSMKNNHERGNGGCRGWAMLLSILRGQRVEMPNKGDDDGKIVWCEGGRKPTSEASFAFDLMRCVSSRSFDCTYGTQVSLTTAPGTHVPVTSSGNPRGT